MALGLCLFFNFHRVTRSEGSIVQTTRRDTRAHRARLTMQTLSVANDKARYVLYCALLLRCRTFQLRHDVIHTRHVGKRVAEK